MSPRFSLPLALALVVGAATSLLAQNPPQQPPPIRMAASSFATVEVHVNQRPIGNRWYEEDAGLTGPARIAISYGQPHARGRKIVAGLIPNDSIWRFGANIATTLHTDLDIALGTLAIPRGDYTLFLQHAGDRWNLIVNGQTAQWGTDYNAAKDVGRIAMTAKTMADNEESLTMYLVPDSPRPGSGYAELSGVLRVRWGTTELSSPFTIKR
jgi:hypothetical protein